jgi:hypothetical protein
MNLECRILPTSTRNLRQTKAEMRRELEELRWNMRQGGHGEVHSTPGSLADASSFRSPHEPGNGSFSNPSAPRTEASMSPPMDLGIPGSIPNDVKNIATGPTLPRALDGFVVDARKIDDCFALYAEMSQPTTDQNTAADSDPGSSPSIIHSSPSWKHPKALIVRTATTNFRRSSFGASWSRDRGIIWKIEAFLIKLASS